MKYAVISDIHGNFPAFRAVLADAEAHGANAYLLLGDYASSFPWGNDVVTAIRGLKNAVAIAGNGETYFSGLTPDSDFTHEQFKPVYWSYRELSRENLEYLAALPETATIRKIHLHHSMSLFYRANRIEIFHSGPFREMMSAQIFSRDEYRARAREALLSRPDVIAEIAALPDGVYLFGHNHLQFHTQIDGKLFVNPGSCGEQLDWETTAAYTLLTCDGNDTIVTERRVRYDIHAVAAELDASEFTAYAPVWSKIMKAELLSGIDYFGIFVKHLYETGRAMGFCETPVRNEVWDAALKTWEVGNGKI
ncbi:MAG: metallophosphoesterase family protein [Defluviitaleaceae bacterium]|nr:metallophosphoesterase family protein [Defluviitaleaceae bacterium]